MMTGRGVDAESVINAIVQNISYEGVTGWIDLYEVTNDFENFGRGNRETDIVYKVIDAIGIISFSTAAKLCSLSDVDMYEAPHPNETPDDALVIADCMVTSSYFKPLDHEFQ